MVQTDRQTPLSPLDYSSSSALLEEQTTTDTTYFVECVPKGEDGVRTGRCRSPNGRYPRGAPVTVTVTVGHCHGRSRSVGGMAARLRPGLVRRPSSRCALPLTPLACHTTVGRRYGAWAAPEAGS